MTLTRVPGLAVGHWTDPEAQTGCTVVLCPSEGAVASVDVRGGAPGTRETDLLAPEKTVERVYAVLLTGGSAFGLAAADGVMGWLEQRAIGFETRFGRIPIVPAAVIYDLGVGRADVRPGTQAGAAAAEAATTQPVAMGRVGAGAGATCAKVRGPLGAIYGGLGSAALEEEGATVAALAVVNAFGEVIDPDSAKCLTGLPALASLPLGPVGSSLAPSAGENTTLLVVATDAPLSKVACRVLAQSAQAGLARAIHPAHTPFDGDTAFVLSTGTGPAAPLASLAVAVQRVVVKAILAAVRAANP